MRQLHRRPLQLLVSGRLQALEDFDVSETDLRVELSG